MTVDRARIADQKAPGDSLCIALAASHVIISALSETKVMKSVAITENTELGEVDERRRNPERRISSRKKLFRGGRTHWPNGDSSECTVYNFSETGAKLELHGSAPNAFDLAIDGESLRRSCLVVWRKANFVGVKFQVPSQLALSIKNAMRNASDFKKYVEECQTLAQRTTPADSKVLFEMAEAWKTAIRLLRKRPR
jgi:hypothetical protein